MLHIIIHKTESKWNTVINGQTTKCEEKNICFDVITVDELLKYIAKSVAWVLFLKVKFIDVIDILIPKNIA